MRRVSGKNNKRRKTDDPETSDDEENTEENGNTEAKDDGEEQAETSTDAVEENAEEDDAEPEGKSPKKSPKKKGKATKKAGGRKAAKSKKPADEEDEYEVEALVDSRYMRGKRQFKVRWRGHGAEEDSWCGEADLHCPLLIQEYLDSVEDSAGERASGNKKGRKRKNASKYDEDDMEKEYEVERVLEVKSKKNGKREFLIRWKGFSSTSDTWEPEENLNCTDLINKLLAKVEKAKESSDHELRTKPKQTSRLTYRDPTIRTSPRKKSNIRSEGVE